jgi:4-amino-4-deoxy-L-arabinose transferase-like glycosyltransferase
MTAMDHNTHSPHWTFAMALVLTLLVAAGLRLTRLPELPAGLHYDEAANGILASEIARGVETPIFFPSYTGKEVLFFYWAALWMKLLGATPLALRLSAALAGLATVAATVWAVQELLYGQRDAGWVALLTGAFLATSFWHLILSRYGFRAVMQPLMQALTVAALWRGLRLSEERGERREERGIARGLPWLLLAGLCCGLTAYTYLAARAFPIPLAAALLALLVADRGHRRARLGQLALFVAVAALVLAPLARYWLTHPGSFLTRTQQVAAASWSQAWAGMRACLGMFFLRGDPYVRFNLPHRPLFDPITAALFLLGIVTVVKSPISNLQSPKPASCIQQPASDTPSPAPLLLASRVFLLTYLLIMLLPSALATGEITPSNLRTAGLLPFIYLFPALGLWTLKSLISNLKSPLVIGHWSLVILALVVLTPITATAYFDWATSAALYDAADGDLADVAAYLNRADLARTTPYVASVHYRHPTLAFLAEDYAAIRWVRGGSTVVFPAEGEGLLILPRSESKDLGWVQSVLPDGSLVAAPPGPDGAPAFHAYRVGPAPGGSTETTEGLTPTHPLTADLGHVALVLGYDVVGQPRSGERAEVAVWWRVLNSPDRGDYGPVARLADPWGFVWGEKQPFHYPSEQWTPGEWIVDHLLIPVGPGAPPGDYRVHFSLYSESAGATLPVLDNAGRYAGSSVELPLRLARALTPALSRVEGPPDPGELGIRNRLDAHSGGLTLLGVNLDTKRARPGEPLYLTLFWRADDSPLPDYDVHLTLDDATLYAGAPVHGTYPTSSWTAGEVVADRYGLRLPLDMPAGDFPLQLRIEEAATGSGRSQPLGLGVVSVLDTERVFEVPPISHPLTATLGGQVQLLGYDLSAETAAPGDTLTLTLYWRALTEMDESYTVFTHLLAPDGSLTGQRDNPPAGGTYPTDLWLAGEVVADVYEIPIRADAAPGAHRLEVGMYVAETGARLPIDETSDDAVLLQQVTVTRPW